MEQLLRELGCNKKAAAEYFGVSRTTIYSWFKDMPDHVRVHLELLVSIKREIDSLRGK